MTADGFIILFIPGTALVGFICAYSTLFAIDFIARQWEKFEQSRLLRCVEQKLCFHCGYDIRANTSHCPECGAAIWWRHGEISHPTPKV